MKTTKIVLSHHSSHRHRVATARHKQWILILSRKRGCLRIENRDRFEFITVFFREDRVLGDIDVLPLTPSTWKVKGWGAEVTIVDEGNIRMVTENEVLKVCL